MPVKKVGKKQLKNYALLDGVSVSDMTREQVIIFINIVNSLLWKQVLFLEFI